MAIEAEEAAMDSVVVTGASSGIGRATALMMAANGWRVFAGVRTDAAMADLLAAADRVGAGARLTAVRLDVANEHDIATARDLVAEQVGELTGIVNNAGTTVPCPFEYLPMDVYRRQVEVNLTGAVAVTSAFLPLLRRPGGRIVSVSSPAALVAIPFMTTYVISKLGLEGISGVLRKELGPSGIHVAVIEPGLIATDMKDKLRRDTDELLAGLPEDAIVQYGQSIRAVSESIAREAERGADPAVVARAIRHALTAPRPRNRYLAGPKARRLMLAARFLPDRAIDRVVARLLNVPAAPRPAARPLAPGPVAARR
jgi:NAD(P)-dependent dehydrogenase (short-subunit alcohol dehydrogenase family)